MAHFAKLGANSKVIQVSKRIWVVPSTPAFRIDHKLIAVYLVKISRDLQLSNKLICAILWSIKPGSNKEIKSVTRFLQSRFLCLGSKIESIGRSDLLQAVWDQGLAAMELECERSVLKWPPRLIQTTGPFKTWAAGVSLGSASRDRLNLPVVRARG